MLRTGTATFAPAPLQAPEKARESPPTAGAPAGRVSASDTCDTFAGVDAKPRGSRGADRFEAACERAPAVAAEGGSREAGGLTSALAHAAEALGGKVDAIEGPLGDVLQRVAGTHALRHTSVLVGAGLRLNVPGVNVNAGLWANEYFPSVALAEKAGGYREAMYTNFGADLESPIGGVGWGRRGKASKVVNLFFVTASFDSKQEVVFIGIPGILGITLGRDVERGSYATWTASIPLTPLWFFGPLFTTSLEIYSPLLDPVNTYVTRPVAAAFTKAGEAIASAAKRAWSAVRDAFTTGERDASARAGEPA